MFPQNTLRSIIGDVNFKVGSTGVKEIGRKDPLYYYDVSIQFDGTECSTTGMLLSFEDGGSAMILSDYLNSIDSPYVMKAYGYLEVEGTSPQDFLALPCFDKTFACFIEQGSDMTVENGRFSEVFIEVTGGVVKGLLTLHKMGFCCPAFSGKDIGVTTEDGHVHAKFWNFSLAESELKKDGDWVRLADMIEEASRNHQIYSPEIADLCMKMRNGELKGLKVLKHCGLLSGSQKCNQILALNTYAMIYKGQTQHPYVSDPVKSKIHVDLFKYLDKCVNWSQLSSWMIAVRKAKNIIPPAVQNGGNFLNDQRSMIEHGNLYVPPPPPPELVPIGNSASTDLEEECRKLWPGDLLKLHNFATDLELAYE